MAAISVGVFQWFPDRGVGNQIIGAKLERAVGMLAKGRRMQRAALAPFRRDGARIACVAKARRDVRKGVIWRKGVVWRHALN